MMTNVAFRKILVPVDFEEPSKHALEMGVDLAKQYGASLTIVHTWEVPAYAYSGMEVSPMDLFTPIQKAARDELNALLSEVKLELPKATGVLKQGSPWREILSMIEDTKPDLVVMGTHGRRGLARVLLGSVAEKIVRTSPVPVLTVSAKAAV
jgi:nucleotide-binding universal stress UspA family protein